MKVSKDSIIPLLNVLCDSLFSNSENNNLDSNNNSSNSEYLTIIKNSSLCSSDSSDSDVFSTDTNSIEIINMKPIINIEPNINVQKTPNNTIVNEKVNNIIDISKPNLQNLSKDKSAPIYLMCNNANECNIEKLNGIIKYLYSNNYTNVINQTNIIDQSKININSSIEKKYVIDITRPDIKDLPHDKNTTIYLICSNTNVYNNSKLINILRYLYELGYNNTIDQTRIKNI